MNWYYLAAAAYLAVSCVLFGIIAQVTDRENPRWAALIALFWPAVPLVALGISIAKWAESRGESG